MDAPPPPPPLPPQPPIDVINQKECGICLTNRTEQICFDMFRPRDDDPQEMPYLVWKHVGLQFTHETGKHYVCRDCGNALFEFNRFYLMVQNVHQQRVQANGLDVAQPKPEPTLPVGGETLQAGTGVNQNGVHGAGVQHGVGPTAPVDEPGEANGLTLGAGPAPGDCQQPDRHRLGVPHTTRHETEPESSRTNKPTTTGGTPSRKRKNQEMDEDIVDIVPKLVCDMCDDRTEYGTLNELNQHAKQVHGDELARVCCPQCGKLFRGRVKLHEHMSSVHGRADTAPSEDDVEKLQSEQMDKEILEFYKRITCEVCEAGGPPGIGGVTLYATVKELNHHMRLVHGQQAGTVKCPLCEKKIRTRPKLLEHKRTHQSNALLLEEDSGKSGTAGIETGPELTEEQTQTLDREIFDFYKPIICEICEPEKSVATAGELTTTTTTTSGGEPADEAYRSLKQLNQHMRTVHGLESGTIKCQLCAKKFRSRVKLLEHKDMHLNPERYRCSVCQEVHQNLDEHMQNKHQEWEFACEECGKRFPFKNRLTAHMAKVHMKKDIICEECNKPFTKFSIEKHKKTVHGATFVCENCPKTFKTRVSLERHMGEHNGGGVGVAVGVVVVGGEQQQPATAPTVVSCTLCQSVLKDEYNLKAHMKRIHAEQTPSTCGTCGKTFKSKHSLNTHIANVCTRREFACTHCGKQFKKRTKLKQHMTTHARSAD